MKSPSSTSALSRVARKPLYEQLVEHLRAYVVEAGLSAGDRLPSERELSERLGVSRASLRQAIVALEVQGILEVKHGEGTFLRAARVDTLPIAKLTDLKRRLPDILDAREAIEVKLAELAAERRTESDLAALYAALAEMQREIANGRTGEQGDRKFHQSVVQAAHSEVLARMHTFLLEDIEHLSHETADQIGPPQTLLEQDRRIGEAITAGEGLAAAAAMKDHLKTTARLKLAAWSPLSD